MLVYAQRSELEEVLDTLDRDPRPFRNLPIVVSELDSQEVLHVHVSRGKRRIVGNPGVGVLVAARLPARTTLARLGDGGCLELARAALKGAWIRSSRDSGFLLVVCAREVPGGAMAAVSFWQSAGHSTPSACRTLFLPASGDLRFRSQAPPAVQVRREKSITIIGLGERGAGCAMDLVVLGVRHLVLIDTARVDGPDLPGRWTGLSDLGRWKTRSVRDRLLDRNPDCVVETYEGDVVELPALLDRVVSEADLVIAATSNLPCCRKINRALLRHRTTGVFFLRLPVCGASALLRIRPRVGPCLECLLDRGEVTLSVPHRAADYLDTGRAGLDAVSLALRELSGDDGPTRESGIDPCIYCPDPGDGDDLEPVASRPRRQRRPRSPTCPACGDTTDGPP